MLYSKKTLLISSLAVNSFPVLANTVPDAGQLLQQQTVQPYFPQADVNIEVSQQLQTGSIDSQQQVEIEKIVIRGNESIATEELHKIVKDAEGQIYSLADLQKLTKALNAYYQQKGYPYSRAYLPAQNLSQGQVTIGVLEAKYDRIQINNQTNTSDELIEQILSPLQSGDIIESAALQQQLMILSRLNGVKIQNVISAGRYPGTSDLTIHIQEDQKITGYIGLDNYGNEYTREIRGNTGLAVNNLLGFGDRLNVNAMTSGHLNYGRLGYEATVNGLGTRLGASYSILDYELDKEYKALDAIGDAQQASFWLSHPVLFSRNAEVMLGVQYDFKRLEDDITLVDSYRHRDIHVGQIRLDVLQKDKFAGGGLTQFGVASDFGHVTFKNQAALAYDQATAKTEGDFVAVSVNVSRLQNLGTSGTQLYTALQAQYSPDNLDSAQQFSIGGTNGIAGYQHSALSGSTGYYALAELKRNLYTSGYNQLSGKVFVDTATVKRQASTWRGFSGDNQESIHSAGFGLNLSTASKWTAALQVGFPFSDKPSSMEERNDVESWFGITKQF